MTEFVTLKSGQWALAFQQPYFFPGSDMKEWLEKFVSRGGGWESHRATEIFDIHHVERVAPKTYWHVGGGRFPRENVIGVFEIQQDARDLRDEFFKIGVAADDQIDFVVDRLARPIRRRVYALALKEIHACLPHIFPRSEGALA